MERNRDINNFLHPTKDLTKISNIYNNNYKLTIRNNKTIKHIKNVWKTAHQFNVFIVQDSSCHQYSWHILQSVQHITLHKGNLLFKEKTITVNK